MNPTKGRAMTGSLGEWLLRRTRFRLRTLVAVVTLCAVVSWWWGVQLRAQREERNAIARLDRFDSEFTCSVPLSDSFEVRRWLGKYCPLLRRVTRINIGGGARTTEFSDVDVPLLDAFRGLETLEFYDVPRLTDAGLERVCRDRRDRLIELHVIDSKVTDAGVERLGVLPGVLSLYISSDVITDRSVRVLAQYPCLEILSLSCPVTDRSLPLFAAMPTLQQLELIGTEVTAEAIENFRDQHPHISVRYW